MAKMTPRTLSGFMELLPGPQQQMERIMEILRRTYSLYGFTPLDTPVIESSEVLLAKGGGETEKQIYRLQKGDADLALRFDLTVPLAKYVALHYNDLTFPFRRYQIGKVYRGERAQRGRNEIFDQGLEELNTVVRYLADFGVPAENFAVDLTIARGLDYYTGTVYETTLLDHPEIGSVCSGGRYDNLAEYYTDRQLPGAGISIGLTRLFYVLGEQGMLNPDLPTAPADVLILPMTEDLSLIHI